MTTSDSVLTGPRPTSVPSVGPVVAELEDEIVSFRRDLHRHPELSYEEYRTTDRIVELLSGYGLSPVRMESTGAYVDVGEGPVVLALRADIDALPVEEETGLPYVSVNDGVAHACGHDMHTAVMAGVAVALGRILRGATADPDLRAVGERVHGTVRVIFQPAEERLPGGSLAVLRQGILDDVPRILAAHCDPQVDVGSIGTRIGAITSAADTIRITLTGRGGHTSRPHLTEDMVFALSQIAVNVPAVLSRRIDVRSASRYVPAIGVADVSRAGSGVRAQAVDRDGSMVDDFRITHADGVTCVRNAPSPGATSSLAIAAHVVDATWPGESQGRSKGQPLGA